MPADIGKRLGIVTWLVLASYSAAHQMHCARPRLFGQRFCSGKPRHKHHNYRRQSERHTWTLASMTSSMHYSSPIEFGAQKEHTATVIVLHGLGDNGEGWSFLPQQLPGDFKHVKFVFPHAPLRSITLNGGFRMPGWYDIYSLDGIDSREDDPGLKESARYVTELVQKEVAAGVPSDRVVVAGFSQGGAIAMMMLRSELKLAGIIGLSTYLPLRNQSPIVSEANKETPVLLCHGNADMVVNYKFGQMTAETLKAAGVDLLFKTYPGMGHSACPEELMEVNSFLTARVPPK